MTLELHLNTPFLTAMSVLGVLFIIILSDPDYSLTSRVILYSFLGIVAILMFWDYQVKKSEIRKIFES